MLIFGLATLAGTVYIVRVVPDFLVRFVLWMFTHTVFKIRIVGAENVPFARRRRCWWPITCRTSTAS